MDAGAILALQRNAGNAAVSAMLARSVLARDDVAPVAEPPVARPLPGGFEWVGTVDSPQLIVGRSWLEGHGVKRGTKAVTGKTFPRVIEPILVKLLDFYPWTKARRAEILANVGTMVMNLGEEEWKQEQFTVPMAHTAFLTFDQLPPDGPVQVYRVEGGLEIYADTRGLGAGGKAGADAVERAATRVLDQLEQFAKLSVIAAQRAVLIGQFASELTGGPPGIEVLRLSEEQLQKAFGEKEWRDFLDKSDAAGESQAGVLVTTSAGGFQMSTDIPKEDMLFVAETLQGFFGKVQISGGKSESLVIYRSDVAKLRELIGDLRKNPQRMARFKALLQQGGKGGGKGFFSFADLLDNAQETVEMQEQRERLGLKQPKGSRDEEPIAARPIRGEIVNKTGALVPSQEGRFEFAIHEGVDAFRVPMVQIRWVAVDPKRPQKPVDKELTKYIEVRPDGVLNDRVFECKFPKTGLYEVHAFVDHNFYLPAHFQIPIEVRTEHDRLEDLDKRAGFGQQKGKAAKHKFQDVADEESSLALDILDVGLGPIGGVTRRSKAADYAQGTRSEGTIDPELMQVEGASIEMGVRVVSGEIEQLELLRKQVAGQSGDDSKDMLDWIDGRLKRLKETRDKFSGVRKDKDAHPVHCQGSYVARTNKAQGGPLTLVSWFTYDPVEKQYHAHLMDHSELVKTETFHFQAEGPTYERTMEKLFFELTRTYPDGSMTFAFQAYKGLEPTGEYVRFERKTDTAVNDQREFWFSEGTSLAINILSALLTIFPPTAAIGIAIGVAYNTAQALDAYSEAERTGTLRAEHKMQLALAVLDVVPALGKASKFVRLGARSYKIINAANLAGQAYLLAESATGEIERMRDGQVSRLAKVNDRIQKLRGQNASDPELRALEDEADKLRRDIKNASAVVFGEMAGSMLLQMAPTAAIHKFADAQGIGVRDPTQPPDAPGTPKQRPGDTPGDTPPKQRPGDISGDTPPKQPADTHTPPKQAPDAPDKRPAPSDVTPAPRPTVAADPALAQGLPDHLRREVAVVRDESLHDNTVKVEYKLGKDGLVSEVSVRAGRAATVGDVALHAHTAELMLGYKGISGRLRTLWETYKLFILGGGTPPKVGSRAWEAKLEMDKLPRVIADRMAALEAGADPGTAARLRSEIEYLDKQLERHKATFERMDLEAGAGSVAAEGGHHAAAVAKGYPSLDKAEGHYYVPTPDGGFELRQRADSPAAPKDLVNEGGKWVLKDGKHRPIPGLDLGVEPLRNVLAVMSGEQAQAIANWMGPETFRDLAAKGGKDLQTAVAAYDRVTPLLSDPQAVAGMQRLVAGEGRGKQQMGIDKRLDVILQIPEGNLRDLLHVLGDPEFRHPFGTGHVGLLRLGRATDELRFMARYGRKVHDALKGAPRNFFSHLLDRLSRLDDAAADELVQKVMDAGTPVKREAELVKLGEMKARPAARRATRHGRADPEDARWPDYQREARKFLTDPAENRQAKLRGEVDLDDAVEALATVLQVRDRVTGDWKRHQNLKYEHKLRILQDLDDIARQGGLATGWINNARGRVAEALFAPGGGLNQKRMPNPIHDAPSGGPGFTQLDGKYGPTERPGNTSGKAEWVEVKSDLVDVPGRLGQPNADAVATARGYAIDGRKDWDALQANPATRDDLLVIRFARKPDTATQAAMLKVLLAPDSPFHAVQFGDDPWHPRKGSTPPPGRTRAEVTGTGAAGTPAPVPVPVGAGGAIDEP